MPSSDSTGTTEPSRIGPNSQAYYLGYRLIRIVQLIPFSLNLNDSHNHKFLVLEHADKVRIQLDVCFYH